MSSKEEDVQMFLMRWCLGQQTDSISVSLVKEVILNISNCILRLKASITEYFIFYVNLEDEKCFKYYNRAFRITYFSKSFLNWSCFSVKMGHFRLISWKSHFGRFVDMWHRRGKTKYPREIIFWKHFFLGNVY